MKELQNLKIAMTWAKEKLDVADKAKKGDPVNWDKCYFLYKKIKNKFDESVEDWIIENC